MAVTAEQQTEMMKTTSALFNKAFSPETVAKFVTFFENNNESISAFADGLIGSQAYMDLYADATTIAEYAQILMTKYNMTYGGTSEADTKMSAFIDYSFANAADSNSIHTVQAIDKFLVATLIPSITTGNVFETMNTVIANKAEVSVAFINNTASTGKEYSLLNVIDTASVETAKTSIDTVTGIVSDGYISGATVFADANGDGVWNAGEAKATTDASGNFSLVGGSGSITASGGTDISTGIAFEGIFTAPEGSTTVSPLTTLVHQIMQSATEEVSAAEAAAQVAVALGIDESIDLLTFDPVAAASDATLSEAAQAAAVATQAAAVQVANIMSQTAATLDGAGITDEEGGALAAAASLANLIVEQAAAASEAAQGETVSAAIDLSSAQTITSAIEGAAQTAAQDAGLSAEEVTAKVAEVEAVSESIAEATANINNVMADAVTNATAGTSAADIFTELAKTQVAAEDIEDLAASAAQSGNSDAVTAASDVESITAASEEAADTVAAAQEAAQAAIAEEEAAAAEEETTEEETSGNTTPTPTPPADTTAPTVTLTYSTDSGSTYNTTIKTKDADTLTIKATFSEAIADASGATIAIDNSILATPVAMTKVSTTEYTYALNVPSGDVATATVTIAGATDAAGNVISATPTNSTFSVDNTAPTLSAVTIASNNANTDFANVGDVVTLSFTSSEELGATPTVTIGGNSATVTNTSGNNYTATYTIQSGDTEGALSFTIDFADTAGNTGTQVTTVTDSSSVTFDKTAPDVSSLTATVPNTAMQVGDTVTVSIGAAETGLTLKDGSNIDGFVLENLVDNGDNSYTATFTVTNGGTDVAANADIPVSVILVDAAGNESTAYTTAISQDSDSIDANVTVVTDTATWNTADNNSETAVVVDSDITLDSTTDHIANVVVNSGCTLTGTAAELTTLNISGDGAVVISDDSTTLDLSNMSVDVSLAGDVTLGSGKVGSGDLSIATGKTLTVAAADITGKTVTGLGTVAVTELQATAAANLSNITATTVTAAVASDFTFTGNLGNAVVTLADDADMTISAGEAAGNSFDGTANGNTSTVVVTLENANEADKSADLTTIAIGSNDISLASVTVKDSLTFTGTLHGTVATTVADSAILTANYGVVTGKTINHDGSESGQALVVNVAAADSADLSTITSDISSITANLTEASNVTLGSVASANVTGSTGNDGVVFDGSTAYSGNVALGAGVNSITLVNNSDISGLSELSSTGGSMDANITGSVTLNAAQNALLVAGTITADGTTDQITLSDASTSIVGDSAIETYVLAAGTNTFTVGELGQNVNASATGVNTIQAAGTLTGTYTGNSSNDILTITGASDISGATIGADFTTLNLADSATVTMTKAQHAAFSTAINATVTNTNTITIKSATDVDIVADADVNYIIEDDTNGNTVAITGVTGTTSITANSADDAVAVAIGGTYTGTLVGAGGNDTISLADGADISGATIGADFTTLAIASGGSVTMTDAQYAAFSSISGAGAETITFSDTTTTRSAVAGVEKYVFDDTVNSFTAAATTTHLTGGTDADTFIMGTNMSTSVTINGGAGTDEITMTDGDSATTDLDNVTNVEKITLGAAATEITTVDGLVASSASLYVDATSATSLTWDGTAEADGVFLVNGSTGADTIKGGAGNDVIRGGAGTDAISGGDGSSDGDDTFVVLGAIAADDYDEADVATTTGAYKLGLATLIDTGLATSDSGTDGTGKTYNGGDGTNTLEIWGAANLSKATINNIDAIDTHSTLNIDATQLATLFSDNSNTAITLNLCDEDSIINITNATAGLGIELFSYFGAAIDSGISSGLSADDSPTINITLDSLGTGDVTYTIEAEDMVSLAGNGTITDQIGEKSVMRADGSTITAVIANDENDIVIVDNMSSGVTVNGGDGDDILVYTGSTNADDLDSVTNVEIIALQGGATSITTVDALVDGSVQQNGLAISAEMLQGGGLTFNGSVEDDGFFRITGSDQADSLTGGAGSDYFVAGDEDIIDGGADTDNSGSGGSDHGDVVTFDEAVSSANLIDNDLKNIEVLSITDYGADNTEVYDFSIQSEGFKISVNPGKDNSDNDITNGVTVKGGKGNDIITLGSDDSNNPVGTDIIYFADTAANNGSDVLINFESSVDKINVDTFVTDVVGGAFVAYDSSANTSVATSSIINYTNNSAINNETAALLFEKDDDDDSSTGAKMEIDDNSSIILVVQDNDHNSDTNFDAQVYYVSSNADGSAITATIVGTIMDVNGADSTSLVFADFA